ncbi:hypothetical protein B0H16DRAFT_1486034 [Mycena metata]|uniref:Uncharacterized protein n=1 Tax=Mycena metata TaxID=1033252 RepID=A0AAD7DN45_9AGAR|nr:hypothetical protein B0H16DRAFT_1486034 [Mycena metata]
MASMSLRSLGATMLVLKPGVSVLGQKYFTDCVSIVAGYWIDLRSVIMLLGSALARPAVGSTSPDAVLKQILSLGPAWSRLFQTIMPLAAEASQLETSHPDCGIVKYQLTRTRESDNTISTANSLALSQFKQVDKSGVGVNFNRES